MAVWSVPKGTELLENVEPVLDSLGIVWVFCVIIYAINYGLDVVGQEMAMDFGSTKWNQCLVRGLPTDSPLLSLGLLKTVPVCLIGPDMVHLCCKQNIASIRWLELCERNC